MRLVSLIATISVAVATAYVPPNMELPSSWTDVTQTQLTPLEFRSEAASALEGKDDVSEAACIDAASVIRQHSGSLGCIAFAVRRPGEDKPLDGFGLFGVVKEVGVDDPGLYDFYNDYFTYPLYKDESQTFYTALGTRKLAISTWNPIKMFRGMRNMSKRLSKKNISGNYKGEGIVQGGIIIFDAAGKARFAYREKTGSEVPVEDIIAVVKELRKEGKSQSS
ncbi:hypothetical protein QTG54_007115 [Skeletonema marinoi]|uniref:Peroxiredoxin-like 2A n=1 Tax=Skeletonema marinoi TaxID=267567 RepID=A0AAD8YCI6_9STRA|nr:hypothetical protein QTG54_007115 [Skeletonema marinoi]